MMCLFPMILSWMLAVLLPMSIDVTVPTMTLAMWCALRCQFEHTIFLITVHRRLLLVWVV
jgi:hypothetical protein